MGNYWDELMATDEGAANYMSTYGEGPGAPTRFKLGEFINDGETVLDVGCGPGWNYDHFKEYGPKIADYLGLDYSERFVRVANKRNPDMYQLGDVRDVPVNDNTWDVVIMQDTLEHTNGYEVPVREALRVARKRAIFTFWKAWRKDGDGDQINDDGNDGYGANYQRGPWEQFLDSLDLHWMSDEIEFAGKTRYYYIVDKEEPHGHTR